MHRRDVLQLLAMATVAGGAVAGTKSHAHVEYDPQAPRPKFAVLIYPDMVLLDVIPALTAFQMAMGDVQLIWKNTSAVRTDVGIEVRPSTLLNEAFEAPDVLFIPGGLIGTVACMEDLDVVNFVEKTGNSARYVTSVCTGSLLLGAAGLLNGYRATGHWQSRYALTQFGATLNDARVVTDRNRITGGGVTAGLDFGLVIAALIRGEEWAKSIQLILEYAPAPPYHAGTPMSAGTEVTTLVSDLLKPGLVLLDAAVARAKVRLRL